MISSVVIEEIIGANLPLTALELHNELREHHRIEEPRLLEFAEGKSTLRSEYLAQKAVPTVSAAFDNEVAALIVQHLREDGHKLAAVTVAEAYGIGKGAGQSEGFTLRDYGVVFRHHAVGCDGALPVDTVLDAVADCCEAATTPPSKTAIVRLEERVAELECALFDARKKLGTESSDGECVRVLAERMPTTIASIAASKRECVVPLLRVVIEMHPSAVVRTSMCGRLLSLYKRPVSDQRQVVLGGVEELCATIGRVRVEAELVPEILVLAAHSYHERRCLAVQCAALVAHVVGGDSRHAMLMGVCFPLSQDISSTVRETVAGTLSSFWGSFNDAHQESQAIDMCLRLLLDDRRQVEAAMRDEMTIIVGKCAETGSAGRTLVPVLMSSIAQVSSGDEGFTHHATEHVGSRLLHILIGVVDQLLEHAVLLHGIGRRKVPSRHRVRARNAARQDRVSFQRELCH